MNPMFLFPMPDEVILSMIDSEWEDDPDSYHPRDPYTEPSDVREVRCPHCRYGHLNWTITKFGHRLTYSNSRYVPTELRGKIHACDWEI